MIETSHIVSHAVFGQQAHILDCIHEKDKNIAICERNIAHLQTELDSLLKTELEFKASGSLEEVHGSIQTFFENTYPDFPLLRLDIIQLLVLFEQVTGSDTFRLLFTTVSTDMCRKFHSDINDLRLLCTYAGKGTLWLSNTVAEQLKSLARSQENPMEPDEKDIQQAPTGSVVILKGAMYPGATPVVHRSPSIEARHEKRLLLRLDTKSFF